MSIPKVIHYCWFGGKPLPKSALKCIASWKKYLPDYEIKRWDESNFDVNIIPYTSEAYEAGKYAFVSDYARFWILFKCGGLYFDTDVELIGNLSDIVCDGQFMGVEQQNQDKITVAPGLGLGAEEGDALIRDLMSIYESSHFVNEDGKPCLKNIVEITTDCLRERGLINSSVIQSCCGYNIYPKDYFCPIDYDTRELKITDNTRSIHHYAESWVPRSTRIKNMIGRIFGKRILNNFVALKRKLMK